MERARAKVLADQLKSKADRLKSKNEQDQKVLCHLDKHKESIRENLAASTEFCLPIINVDKVEKSVICSWFAANGLTCDKNVSVKQLCAYDDCCWTASLKKKSLWSRLFGE